MEYKDISLEGLLIIEENLNEALNDVDCIEKRDEMLNRWEKVHTAAVIKRDNATEALQILRDTHLLDT